MDWAGGVISGPMTVRAGLTKHRRQCLFGERADQCRHGDDDGTAYMTVYNDAAPILAESIISPVPLGHPKPMRISLVPVMATIFLIMWAIFRDIGGRLSVIVGVKFYQLPHGNPTCKAASISTREAL